MSDQIEEIQKLLRLKRYESPPEGYFDDFLKEFQSRQRSELMRRSARSLLLERISTYFSGFGAPRWAGAAAGACALVLVAFLLLPGGAKDQGEAIPSTSPPVVNRSPHEVDIPYLFGDVYPTPPSGSTHPDHLVVGLPILHDLQGWKSFPDLGSGLSLDF